MVLAGGDGHFRRGALAEELLVTASVLLNSFFLSSILGM